MVPGFEATDRDDADEADAEPTNTRHSMRPGETWLRNWVSIRTNRLRPTSPIEHASLHRSRDRDKVRADSAETDEESVGRLWNRLGARPWSRNQKMRKKTKWEMIATTLPKRQLSMTPLLASELPEVARIVTATTARMTTTSMIRGNAIPHAIVRDEAEARATSGQATSATQRARKQKHRRFDR